ncbi:hypothetical protein RFI_21902 [Reticulomyxa filosa]|uniref:Uncharacterized protein n=1 Tax=Reticulomyxa filosa TaxID=46433 RepID=X6MPW4_RETFI|nr:hypothetical protein RFI_21902 [Reticulomyxa filosa]|eukprot:ETO15462.1 hypothetical protein RFI_21902 [Reticulomyxa filosa]
MDSKSIIFGLVGIVGFFQLKRYVSRAREEIYLIKEKIKVLEEKVSNTSNEFFHYLEDNEKIKSEIVIGVDLQELSNLILKKNRLTKNLGLEAKLHNTWCGENCTLSYKNFRFINFYDGSIWSDFHKTFVDEKLVEFNIYSHNPDFIAQLEQSLEIAKIKNSDKNEIIDEFCRVYISPYSIATSMAYGEIREFDDEEVLAGIPRKIMWLLSSIALMLLGYEMNAIRKFPKDLQKQLNESNVIYKKIMPFYWEIAVEAKDDGPSIKESNRWYEKSGLVLSRNKVEFHNFTNKCLSISIKIETNKRLVW